LAFSNDFIMTIKSAEPGLVWLSANASWNATAGGSGSTPSPEKEPSSPSPSPNTADPAPGARFHLLLAEDNLPDALLVKEAIQMENLPFHLHLVSDGQQAIDFIARAEADRDAPSLHGLVLDLNLPKRDGFEVLRRLRASPVFKDVPVLIVTSSDAPSDLAQAATLGAGYFRKPPSYEEFLKLGGVLRQMLNLEAKSGR
jgi:CheY-like chemotaxis protein